MPKIRVTPVIGLPQFNGWSQVIESPPHSSVRTVMSVAIEGTHAGNVGRDIANFFSSQVIQTLEEFHGLLEEVVAQAAENDVRILCAAGFFSATDCAYATFNGAVLLKRQKQVGTILSSGNQLKLISGTYTLQDTVIFSTLSSAHFFSEIEQKFEQGFDTDTIVTSIVPGLHAEDNSSLSSLAFVTFLSDKVAMSAASSIANDDDDVESDVPVSTVTAAVPPALKQRSDQRPDSKQSTTQVAAENEKNQTAQLPEEVAHSLTESLDRGPAVQKKEAVSMQRVGAGFSKVGAGFLAGVKRITPYIRQGIGLISSSFRKASKTVQKIRTKDSSQVGFFHQLFPGKDVYLESSPLKKKKTIKILVSVLVLIVLTVGIGFLVISKQNAERAAAQEALAPLIQQAAQAEQLVESDPVTARDQLQSVLSQLAQLSTTHEGETLFLTEVSEEQERLQALYETISGLDEVQELPIFYDLRLVSSDFVAAKVVSSGNLLYFFDTEQKTIIQLQKETKKVTKFSLPLESVTDIAAFDSSVLVLGAGITELSVDEEALQTQEVIAEGDSNRGATLLGTYSPYVYVVNPEKRNIYRYAQSDDTFSDPIGWMQAVAQGLNYEEVTSIAIDGDIWLGTRSGAIFQFTRGIDQEFSIRGLQNPFTTSPLIHTSEDSEKLFILEAQNNRVVILQKNGDFLKEITNASLGSVTDIVVDEAKSRIYAVSGSVVFEVSF